MGYRIYTNVVAAIMNGLNMGAKNLLFLIIGVLYRWALGAAQLVWADVYRSTNLAGTYANGSSGVGATLTKSSAGAFASEDGVTPYLGMLVLLAGQTTRANNGLYKLTRLGDASSVAWQLTRDTNWDQSAEMISGSLFYVRKGTTYGGTTYAYTGASSPTVGTTALTFAADSLIRTFSASLSGSSWSPVRVLTAAALPANTYAAATQTKTANANGTLTVDGVLLAVGDRFWDKDAGTGSERGLFEVIDAGSAGTPWKAARAADANVSADFVDGKTFTVREGTQAHTAWQFTNNAPFVLDTDTPVIARETNVMLTDAAQTNTGAKTFAHLTLIIRNAAATFAATFSTLATAARAVVFPDRAGNVTIATSADTQIGAGALSVSTETSFVETSAAGVVFTLASGEYVGQRKRIMATVVTAPGTDTAVITPAAGGPWTLEAVGQSIVIEWNGAAWALVSDGRTVRILGQFDDLAARIWNGAGTFFSQFRSLATATRIVTFPDAAGIVELMAVRQSLAGAGAIDLTSRLTLSTIAAAGVVQTLADGVAGQRKIVKLGTIGTPGTDTLVVTPANGGPWTLDVLDDWILIEFDGTNWILVADGRHAASGIYTFVSGIVVKVQLALRNAGDTFAHTFTSLATAARAITWGDYAGIPAVPPDEGAAGEVLVSAGAGAQPDWGAAVQGLVKRTVTVAFNDGAFGAAATATINIGAILPANARIVGHELTTFTAFQDLVDTIAVDVEVGENGGGADVDSVITSTNVRTGATGFPKAGTSGVKGYPLASESGEQIAIKFTAGGNLNTLTAGSVTVNVFYIPLA